MKNLTINKISENLLKDYPFKIRFLILFFSVMLFTVNISKIEAQWQYAGDTVIQCITFYNSFNSNENTPYIALNSDYTTFVKKFDGLNWTMVGPYNITGDPMPQVSPNIVLDSDTPYVSLASMIDHGGGIYEWGFRVFKYISPSWTQLGSFYYTTLTGAQPPQSGLLLYEHMPYVVFSDEADSFKIKVKNFNGAIWSNVGSTEISTPITSSSSLATDGINLFLAFKNLSSEINVMKFDGTNWVTVGTPGFSGGTVGSISLAAINGTPFVAFQDQANGSKTSVMKFDGVNWVYIGLPGISDGYSSSQCLSFIGLLPIVSFWDLTNAGMTVMKFEELNWTSIGEKGYMKGRSIGYPNLRIINSIPFVAFMLDSSFCPYQPISVMKYGDIPLPIELSLFFSTTSNRNVSLFWTTSSETNNSGFEIERKSVNGTWTNAGFIAGHGTVTYPVNYTFTDWDLASSTYNYRLKQIDFNGNYEFFDLSEEVVIGVPDKFSLHQNYPNPYNPVTKIRYDLPVSGNTSLKIYDNTGREMKTLVSGFKEAGYYTAEFNGSGFASGVYYYKIESGNFIATKKMVLIK